MSDDAHAEASRLVDRTIAERVHDDGPSDLLAEVVADAISLTGYTDPVHEDLVLIDVEAYRRLGANIDRLRARLTQ